MRLKGEERRTAICNACRQPASTAVVGRDGELYHVECVQELP